MCSFEKFVNSLILYCDLTDVKIQLLIAVPVLLATLSFIKFLKTPKNLPPGPWGLPIFGYKFFLGKKPHVTVANLRKKYGDVMRINLGKDVPIFLTSHKAIKEALVKQADIFAARADGDILDCLRANPGIIRSSGEVWSELRRFSLSKLRDFGFGKSSLEPRIKDEIHYFLKDIESFKGNPIPDMGEVLRKSITNVICIIMTGKRYDYTDKPFLALLELSNEHLRLLGIDRFVTLIPRKLRFKFLLRLLGLKSPVSTCLGMIGILSKVVEKFDGKHESGNEDNFIDAWLTESEKKKNQKTHLTKSQLPTVLYDLFLAGSDTTTNTLGWSLLFMIEHPDIQNKVHAEIDDVIGRERTPSMDDQKLMPFTEAVLMEVNRIITIVPLSLIHRNTKDTTIMDKFIPKDSTIVVNLWAVHNDPTLFPEPEKFKPERFLTESGQLKKTEEYIPFSLGKRQCMGEALARMELFLYFASMLQNFKFQKVNEKIDLDYDYALITMPRIQPICALPRQ